MNSTDRTKWLASLKPGDEVALQDRFGSSYVIMAVERLTKTHIVTQHRRIRRVNGRAVGSYDEIVPVTDDIRLRILRGRVRDSTRRSADYTIDWDAMTTEQLTALRNMMASLPKKRARNGN